jgi:choice-of-anchor C domain-containing protein
MNKLRFGIGLVGAMAVVATFAAAPAQAGVNLLSNGSFETPVVDGGYTTIGAGGTMGAWTVTSGSVDHIGSYWNAADGTQSVDMSGDQAGSISQTVNTSAGQEYQLSFWMAGNTDGGNTVKSLTALIDGNTLATAKFDTTGHSRTDMGWTEYSYDFVSAGGPTAVSFQSNEENAYGAALDNVSLQAVPEASTVVLFGLMLVGGAFLLRNRASRIA